MYVTRVGPATTGGRPGCNGWLAGLLEGPEVCERRCESSTAYGAPGCVGALRGGRVLTVLR